MNERPQHAPSVHPLAFLVAFGTGGLLALMIHFNGMLGHYGNALFASWAAHATGTVAALVLLLLLSRFRKRTAEQRPPAPFWAYLGGLSGAATVALSATSVNSPVGLPGTLALGLVGQMVFSLAADGYGLFGLPRRTLSGRDIAALGLVLAGSLLILLPGKVSP